MVWTTLGDDQLLDQLYKGRDKAYACVCQSQVAWQALCRHLWQCWRPAPPVPGAAPPRRQVGMGQPQRARLSPATFYRHPY